MFFQNFGTVLMLLLCVNISVQRRSHDNKLGVDPDDFDNYDSDDFDNVDLPVQPRRPPPAVPDMVPATSRLFQSKSTTASPIPTTRAAPEAIACPSSSRSLPRLFIPPARMLIDNSTIVRTRWLLEPGPHGPVTGGVVTVRGAARAIRVLPAALPMRCGDSFDSMPPEPQAASRLAGLAAAHNCEAVLPASAAGAGGCLGQLVSDGRQLLSGSAEHGRVSAHFGVTEAGEVFFGYPDSKPTELNRFKQLIGGQGWLVRDGKNFASASLRLEACSRSAGHPDDGEAAAAAAAAKAPSSRSAIGRNRAGELSLVHIVGRPGLAGLSLSDFADLLLRLGMEHAVSLETGDAAGLMVNGTLIGSPTAVCGGGGSSSPQFACLRPAAAVLCISRRQQQLPTPSSSRLADAAATPAAGSGGADKIVDLAVACRDSDGAACSEIGGRCDSSGRCVCRPYFEGPGCARRRCLCLNGGVCQQPDSEACRCRPGFTGSLCELPCPAGFYGQDCARVCVCGGGESVACNPANGTCAGVSDLAKNESSLLRSIQQRLRNLGSINVALVGLTAVLSLSLLLNLCLLVQCCRMRCRRRRREKAGKSRYQPLRLLPSGRESDSDPEAVM
ncbi:hypothetical protein BOX15_Mlig008832g3 [Macrostomum lignano]|uniref:EGF-like domain-containing protein n=3 Tax=Macrostomum lignano TaxID=282301 RepID=A0A267FLX4_9PLAT|nr:hypothetical protein BOX15_Mlig008832g3 [Macrostomum lignano]